MENPNGEVANVQEHQTIWMGTIQPHWDENYLYGLFAGTGEVTRVKLMRNPANGLPSGYAFIEFRTHEAAQHVLDHYNGRNIPGTNLLFRLNWGSRKKSTTAQQNPVAGLSSIKTELSQTQDKQESHSLFIGDLSPGVDDAVLFKIFEEKFPTCEDAKVIIDQSTGISKGYGFVRFCNKNDALTAMKEMKGTIVDGRQIRIGEATQRKSVDIPVTNYSHSSSDYAQQQMYNYPQPMLSPLYVNGAPHTHVSPSAPTSPQSIHGDPPMFDQGGFSSPPVMSSSSTVFIGNLDPSVNSSQIKAHFEQCGEIESIKIPANRGCGFVKFSTIQEAGKAIMTLNNTVLGSSRVRLDWGKFSTSKPSTVPPMPNNPNMHYVASPMASPTLGPVALHPGIMYAQAGWPQMSGVYYPASPGTQAPGYYFGQFYSPTHSPARGYMPTYPYPLVSPMHNGLDYSSQDDKAFVTNTVVENEGSNSEQSITSGTGNETQLPETIKDENEMRPETDHNYQCQGQIDERVEEQQGEANFEFKKGKNLVRKDSNVRKDTNGTVILTKVTTLIS